MSAALLAGTTACSSGNPSGEAPAGANASSPSTTSTSAPSSTTAPAGTTAPRDLPAAQVVSGLSAAGYRCGRDGDYAICTTGPVAVWVLTGTHPRPPVVSFHSLGAAATATAEIAKVLPKTLEIAHVGPAAQVTEWFGQQAGKTSARTTAGDWQVDWSVEVDTEEPGAHLSLTDTLCRSDCQAE